MAENLLNIRCYKALLGNFDAGSRPGYESEVHLLKLVKEAGTLNRAQLLREPNCGRRTVDLIEAAMVHYGLGRMPETVDDRGSQVWVVLFEPYLEGERTVSRVFQSEASANSFVTGRRGDQDLDFTSGSFEIEGPFEVE